MDGNPAELVTYSGFQAMPNGAWMPTRARIQRYMKGRAEPFVNDVITIRNWSVGKDYPKETFTMEFPEGTGIFDYRIKKTCLFRVGDMSRNEMEWTIRQAGNERRAEVADDDPFGGKRVSFDFIQMPFSEAVAFVREKTGVNIVLDQEAVPENAEVTLKVTDMKASQALDWICNGVGLWWITEQDGSVLLTSMETVMRRMMRRKRVTRVYDIADLVDPASGLPKWYTPPTKESLIEFIQKTTAPGTWREEYGTSITCQNGKLTVAHVEKVHQEVRRFLDAVRETPTKLRAGIRDPVPKIISLPEDPRKKKLAGQKISLSIHETPLADLVASMREGMDVNIILDEERVPAGLRVTLEEDEIELSEALDKICSMCRLEYLVRDDGSVLITTPEQVLQLGERLLKIYNVVDLLEAPPTRLEGHPEGTAVALVELIKRTVAPGTWGEQNRGSLQYKNGRFMVFHVSEVHVQILKLLNSLRGGEEANTTEN